MIREGSKSKEQYLREQKAEEKEKITAASEGIVIKALKQDHGQSR